jgi:hypothetical protein
MKPIKVRKSSIVATVKNAYTSPSVAKINNLSTALRKDLAADSTSNSTSLGVGGLSSEGVDSKPTTFDSTFVAPEARTPDEWMKIEEMLKTRIETLEIVWRRRQVGL